MAIPETGRLSAHTLIDAVSAYDPENAGAAVDLALQRLTEIDGALGVTVDDGDEGLVVDLDLSHLLGGTIVTLNWLVHQLAEATSTTADDVIVRVRDFLDS